MKPKFNTEVKAALEANAELITSAELKPTVVRLNQIAYGFPTVCVNSGLYCGVILRGVWLS